ncbi:hypothetical protein GPA10_22320 [Streptomyces sp. p1417]|uniref:DUF3168 domain-containing protein n=1 Tax=Streptomyces typhae TaxID=2681492 RepID=A0A6L6X0X2_9ACTN|nr:hypothetical protein [Streptomyces typhae]MVO87421.1 hypothetical protein [Streptomyces typhae]
MRADPIPLLVAYLRSIPEIPQSAVTGTLVGRSVGETTVYLMHSGGYRSTRDRADRMYVVYDVYGASPAEAGDLAYTVREYLLEQLPGQSLGGLLVLDVREEDAPKWHPDMQSLEAAYTGEVSVYLVTDD